MYNLLKDFYISENVPAFGMRADTDQRLPYHKASQHSSRQDQHTPTPTHTHTHTHTHLQLSKPQVSIRILTSVY